MAAHRYPHFDGLRALAVLPIMCFHAAKSLRSLNLQFSPASVGWIGVDVFFVLSGFLITGILLDMRNSPHYFWNFFVRRTLRIWPLYLLVLILVFGIVPIVRPDYGPVIFGGSKPWWSYLIFMQNLLVHDRVGGTGPLAVTWSLAIEEQFYVVCPILCFFLNRKQLKSVLFALILFCPALRMWMLLNNFSGITIYQNTLCRFDTLAMGSLLALLVRERLPNLRILATVLFFLSLAGVMLRSHSWVWRDSFAGMLVSSVLVFCLMPTQWTSGLRVLTNPVLRYIGKISYGLYLLHVCVFDLYKNSYLNRPVLHNGIADDILRFIGLLGITCVVATVSWYWVEKPILKFRTRLLRGDTGRLKLVTAPAAAKAA